MQPKFFWIAVLGIALASVANAATTKKATTQSPQAPATADARPAASTASQADLMRQRLRGLNVYAFYSMADAVDVEGTSGQGQNTSFSGDFRSESTFGFGADYDFYTSPMGLKVNAGGSYDVSRSLTRIVGKAAGEKFDRKLDPKPELQVWTAYLQAKYEIFNKFNVFGGPNYSYPIVKKVTDSDFKGKVGWQIGAGYDFTENVGVDGMYRVINMSGSAGKDAETTNYEKMSMAGFNGRVRYSF